MQEEDPNLFRRYAIQDAKIAAKWFQFWTRFQRQTLGIIPRKIKPTLASAAVAKFEQICKAEGYDILSLLGKDRNGRSTHWKNSVSDINGFAASCYHGGRNEAYSCGFSQEGEIYDIDLAGAYTTSMAVFRNPDWDRVEFTTDLKKLATLDNMTIARVRFSFPKDTRFPCLPVRAREYGLLFPLEGVSYTTGPELIVAREMGAKIEVEHGFTIPWADNHRPFVKYTREINRIRTKYKGTVTDRLAKECGNSLYGKLAQGVSGLADCSRDEERRSRNIFKSRTGEYEPLPPSKITQPVLAAYTTGLVRAVVF